MRYFLDTEFIEDGRTIDLVSVGIVSEDGREWYGQNIEADFSKASDWVRLNVLTGLQDFDIATWTPRNSHPYGFATGKPWFTRREISSYLVSFTNSSVLRDAPEKPEFWGYYADYDWVVICQLFGTMMDLPKGWPMYCRDIKQLCDDRGNPRLPEQGKGEHHALADAKWNKQAWEFLQALEVTNALS